MTDILVLWPAALAVAGLARASLIILGVLGIVVAVAVIMRAIRWLIERTGNHPAIKPRDLTPEQIQEYHWQAVLGYRNIWYCTETGMWHYSDEGEQLDGHGFDTLAGCTDAFKEYAFRLSTIPSVSCPACIAKRIHSEWERVTWHDCEGK